MNTSNGLIKFLGIIGVVVIAVAVGVMLFSCNKTVKDDKAATQYTQFCASENYVNFSNNLTNEYSTVSPSGLQTFVESIQSSNPTLYSQYHMTTLVCVAQWQITSGLINQTVYGGKKSDLDALSSLLSSYSDKMSSTLEAVKVFNQDKSTASNEILQNESLLIVKRLNEQNKALVQLNNVLLNCVVSSNYPSITVARGDLKIALLNGLYHQSVVLHNATDAYINNSDAENDNDAIVANAKTTINAYKFVANRKFVYKDINSTNGSEIEDFLSAYKNTKNVDDMLSDKDPATYISKISDEKQKTALTSIWTFFTKLANGGV